MWGGRLDAYAGALIHLARDVDAGRVDAYDAADRIRCWRISRIGWPARLPDAGCTTAWNGRAGMRYAQARGDLERGFEADPEDYSSMFEKLMLDTVEGRLEACAEQWRRLFASPVSPPPDGVATSFRALLRVLLLEPESSVTGATEGFLSANPDARGHDGSTGPSGRADCRGNLGPRPSPTHPPPVPRTARVLTEHCRRRHPRHQRPPAPRHNRGPTSRSAATTSLSRSTPRLAMPPP